MAREDIRAIEQANSSIKRQGPVILIRKTTGRASHGKTPR